MADVKVNINVSDNGTTSKANNNAKELKNTLEAAHMVAQKIRVPIATAAARQGVAASQPKSAAYMAAAQPGGGASDTNLSRGLAGQTGASGRDFAAQAQGLGGLVHVYATFAANLFAVSAAFSALSKAADTTNMIKGLDQLGATSGRALGSLAKQMVAVTDGALSMRDAMTNTAIASAGGMTNANIIRMTEVARKASLALGREMPDSMERLTKGIIKVQPELLDELGIMARVIPAQEAYARQIGKTVSGLTDFEKRQAFANAVLDEGEKKFNAIKIDSNPYSQIAAAMTNIAQSALSLVNTGLGPLLRLLSQSPTALTIAMAGLAAVLLKQAIPAIGQYKKGLEEIKNINLSKVALLSDIVSESGTYDATMSERVKQKYLAENNYATQSNEVRARLLKEANAREEDYREKAVKRGQSILGHETILNKTRDRLYKETAQSTIKYNAAQVQSAYGMTAAFSELNAGIAQSKAGTFMIDLGHGQSEAAKKSGMLANGITRVTGTIGILGGTIATLVSAFMPYIIAITALIGAFGILDSYMTENSKEMEDFSRGLDTVKESGDNVARTLAAIQAKDPLERLSISSTSAISNAFVTLADSIETVAKSSEKAKLKSNWWTDSIDWTKGLINEDVASKTKDAMASSISDSLDLLSNDPELSAKFSDSVKTILNIPSLDTNSVQDSLDKIDPGVLAGKMTKLVTSVKDASREFNNHNSVLQTYKAAADTATKASQDFNLTLSIADPMFKLGESLVSLSSALQKVSESGKDSQQALQDLLKDNTKLALLNPDLASSLMGVGKEFLSNAASIRENADAVKELEKVYADAKKPKSLAKEFGNAFLLQFGIDRAKEDEQKTANAAESLKLARRAVTEQETSQVKIQEQATKLIAEAQLDSFVKGSDLIKTALGNAGEKIALGISRAASNSLTGLQALNANLDFTKREASIAVKQLEAAYANVTAMEKLRIAIEEQSLQTSIANEKEGPKKQAMLIQADALKQFSTAVKDGPSAIKELQAKALSSGTDMSPGAQATRSAGLQVQSLAAATAGLDVKKQEANAKIAEANAAKLYTEQVLIAEVLQQQLGFYSNIFKLESDRIGLYQSLLNIQTEELTLAKLAKDNAAEGNKQISDRAAIEGKINGINKQIAAGINVAYNKQQLAVEDLNLRRLRTSQIEQNINKDLQDSITLLRVKLAISKQEYNLDIAKFNLAVLKSTTNNDILSAEFQAQVNLGNVSEAYRASKEASLGLSRAQLDLSNAQALKDKEIADIQAEANLKKIGSTVKPGELGTEASLSINKDIQSEADKAIALIQIQKDGNQVNFDGKAKILAITEKTALTIAAENELLKNQAIYMQDLVTRTGDLATAFGVFGENIGKVAEAMASMADSDTNYLREKVKLQEIIFDSMDNQKDDKKALAATDAQQKLNKLETQHSKDKLKNTNTVMVASKKLLGEQSDGYKLLTGLEKAKAAVASLGQADMVTGHIKAVSEMITQTIPGIYATASLQLGPILGPIAATAAIAAFVGSAFGGGGGGAAANEAETTQFMIGKTSEDRQKTQGTGGVFGDDTAKSDSIVKSLEIMRSNSIEGLNYDNRMLSALERLADSVVGSAKAIAGTPGLRAGTGFGTQAGNTSTTGFAGSVPILGKALNSIFGGNKTASSSITSAGLQLSGTFKSVMDDTAGSITQYKDVLTKFHEDGGWFSSDKDWSTLVRENQAVSSSVSSSISDVFKEANGLFVEIGAKAGVTQEQITAVLSNLDVSMPVDLMNLTGQALVDELNAVLGSKVSLAAERIFVGFDKFKTFGEDYLATVIRVVDANDKVSQSLKSIGVQSSIVAKWDISETLAKAAGGLERFQTQAAFFKDNFLSAQEKLAPVQKGVNGELTRLGISTNITKDGFKKLVLSQDLTTAAGRKMYQSLMELAPGFNTVADAAEQSAQSRADLESKIYALLGKDSIVLAMSRQKELDAMEESLRPRQIYLNALTDEMALRGKLKTAYDATNNSLTTSIKTLTDYKTALTSGSASTLTPAEKYAQAKALAAQTASAASATITSASTPAEIAARDAAVAKLASVSDAFLAASREVNASSAQYAADFATVTAALDSTTLILSTQQTAVQKQIDLLGIISDATKTTAELLAEYLAAQLVTAQAQTGAVASGSAAASVAIPGHAMGGLAKGISVVGENGPEIVDFINPGRVYSNQASNDLFNTKELIAEIQSLRKEVSNLRADQKEQTGHLIATNYDANTKNAEAITNGNQDALSQQTWNTRSKINVA